MTTREFWKDGVLLNVEEVTPTREEIIVLIKNALDNSDTVAIRCVKAGISFPVDWKNYVSDLRAQLYSATPSLPMQPPYPEGT